MEMENKQCDKSINGINQNNVCGAERTFKLLLNFDRDRCEFTEESIRKIKEYNKTGFICNFQVYGIYMVDNMITIFCKDKNDNLFKYRIMYSVLKNSLVLGSYPTDSFFCIHNGEKIPFGRVISFSEYDEKVVDFSTNFRKTEYIKRSI